MLPGALVVLALSMIYAAFGNVPVVEAIFFGIKAAVLVIVDRGVAPDRQAGAEAARALGHRGAVVRRDLLLCRAVSADRACGGAVRLFPRVAPQTQPTTPRAAPPRSRYVATLTTIAVWLVIWSVPLLALAGSLRPRPRPDADEPVLLEARGRDVRRRLRGARLHGQDVVVAYGWLDAGQMMDGLGLAETTPGPLILVTEFVGYLAAYRTAAVHRSHGAARRLRRAVGDVRAVLPVDLRRRTLHRMDHTASRG